MKHGISFCHPAYLCSPLAETLLSVLATVLAPLGLRLASFPLCSVHVHSPAAHPAYDLDGASITDPASSQLVTFSEHFAFERHV